MRLLMPLILIQTSRSRAFSFFFSFGPGVFLSSPHDRTFKPCLRAALKRLALPPELLTARPKRLRFLIFNTRGRLAHHARRLLLRLAVLTEWISPAARACSCCRCRVEPSGAKRSQLSKDLQATFSHPCYKYIPSQGNNS